MRDLGMEWGKNKKGRFGQLSSGRCCVPDLLSVPPGGSRCYQAPSGGGEGHIQTLCLMSPSLLLCCLLDSEFVCSKFQKLIKQAKLGFP